MHVPGSFIVKFIVGLVGPDGIRQGFKVVYAVYA
jgi:hypothetical protein